jgi:hypothetical protein
VSTDYDIVCDACGLSMHAGQRSAGDSYSFGYGKDDEACRSIVARFAFEHAYHGPGGVRIELADVAEARPSDNYVRIELEPTGQLLSMFARSLSRAR